jgi:hypothetical protein
MERLQVNWVEEIKVIIKDLDGNDPLLYAAKKAIGPKQLTEEDARNTARRAYSGNTRLSSADIGKAIGRSRQAGLYSRSSRCEPDGQRHQDIPHALSWHPPGQDGKEIGVRSKNNSLSFRENASIGKFPKCRFIPVLLHQEGI